MVVILPLYKIIRLLNLNAGLKEDGPKEAQAVGKMNEMNSEKWS